MSQNVPVDFDMDLEKLKVALLSLKAAGKDGFEGMLRLALTRLTGIQFRLAASGLQGGIDGDSAMPNDGVCFEAKRYEGKIERDKVLVKIVDLARRERAADRLWVLGTTTEVTTQLADDIRQDGDQHDISILILDWVPSPLPLLAVAIVFAGDEAIDFLITHFDEKSLQEKVNRDELNAIFKSISVHPDYASCLHFLKSNLNISKLAFSRSVNLNAQWRQETFNSVSLARERLGQALAVAKTSNFPVMRTAIRTHLSSELQAGNCLILSGDEGHGKSWLAAQICAEADGMAVFISAEQFDGVTIDKLDEFLICILINQTGDIADEILKSRWRHRFKAWKTKPLSTSLLVVVDGINQRQSIRWDRLINGLYSRLQEIGGCLIVTVRPQFWEKEVAKGLSFIPKIIDIPVWQPRERDELLKYYKISLDWLDADTLRTLRNPRLLSVAVAILPHHQTVAWKGLTTDRLLIEHLRASQLENFENETFKNLTNRLSEHAAQVMKHVQVSPNEPPPSFKSDSTAVIETRFFRPIAGPGDLYELRDQGLTLALGFTLVDQLWQTQRAKRDLAERIVQLIEPIKAMDRTSDVLFAALLVCALDDIRFDKAIFASLLDAFSNLQNVSDRRFEEFVEIVRHQPSIFFDVLRRFCLEKWQRVNYDWFVHAAYEIAATKQGWKTAEIALHQWLHCYNANAEEQVMRFPVSNPNHQDYGRRLKALKDDIDEVLANLSSYEKQLLEQMVEVSGDLDSLFTLALQLLAGRPLSSFANSFISMGLAFSLDSHMPTARKAFQQLTNFNRVDRIASKESFIHAIIPLHDPLTSRSGQWTIVRMLQATGDELAAIEAITIAKKLREDSYNFELPMRDSWRKIKLANPDVGKTVEVNVGLEQFCSLDPDKMMLSEVSGGEERNYQDYLPLACRFEPNIAYEKTRNILNLLLKRTGFPLRQVILNCEKYIPLIDSGFACQLVQKFKKDEVLNTLPERDKVVCRMFIYRYVANQLSAEEQLNCMREKAFGEGYLFSVIPSLKTQSTRNIIKALKATLDDKDEEAAYLVIIAALYGDTSATPKLEELILRCCDGETSKLRSAACQFAVDKGLKVVRWSHAESSWSAQSADNEMHEDWFGSILLMDAFANNEITVEDLFKRISKRTWFLAAHRLGGEFVKLLADCFIKRLHASIKNVEKISLPAADFTISEENRVSYPLISIDETDRNRGRFKEEKSLEEFFLDLGNPDSFYETRDRLRVVMDTFFKELKDTDLEHLAQNITIEDIACLIEAEPTLLFTLTNIIEQACDTVFVWLKNLAFIVANLISDNFPERAVVIFERAITSQGFLTLDLGDGLTLEHRAIWGSQESEPIKELWRKRIVTSGNDEILFREILAAERFGASSFIKFLVYELATSQDSLDQAYAITIAGYSDRYEEFISIIEKHIDDKSLSGDAARYALIAYENARWGQYWIDKMWDASTSEEFWRCLMMSEICIDSRINNDPKINTQWECFTSVFQRVRQAAIKKHNKEREKKFLGQEVPEKIFVIQCSSTDSHELNQIN